MGIFIKKMTCNATVSFQKLDFFFLFNIVFATLCSSVVSDGSYSSLLQSKHEQILG